MDIEDILDELDDRKDAYDLDGVEITEDDALRVKSLMKDGATFEEAVDAVLDGIREVVSQGWEF